MKKDSILVLNCGSSSIKFSVITAKNTSQITNGFAECLDDERSQIIFKQNNQKEIISQPNLNHYLALKLIVEKILGLEMIQLIGVGHRVVHGGELFSASCLINDEIIDGIKRCSDLAPRHNPASLAGILAIKENFPNLLQVAVFDTAFHQTLSEENYLYAVPYGWYKDYGVRRYGFHGTSFRYINQFVLKKLAYQKIVVAHLGNGASVCAIDKGQSVATSMGLTPLDGLVQGTRSGSIDPAIVEFVASQTQQTVTQVTNDLWKQSGFLGLSEVSNDCRELEAKAEQGDKACQRALSVFINRLQQIIASYIPLLNGVDAIVFTGGIGENSSYIRAQTLKQFGFLNVEIDEQKNIECIQGKQGVISTENSLPVWVIPTDEEKMIAIDTIELIT